MAETGGIHKIRRDSTKELNVPTVNKINEVARIPRTHGQQTAERPDIEKAVATGLCAVGQE